MKNITKKQWGIVSTSIGSILIIVALLTMVGVGSNDTYASTTATKCCPSDATYDHATNKCVSKKTYQCCASGSDCKNLMGYSTCSDITNCTEGEGGLYTCQSNEITSCTCPSGMMTDGNGGCIANPTPVVTKCDAGTYYDGSNSCKACPAGFYCPGGSFSHQTGDINGSGRLTCPAGSYCPAGVSEPTKCPAGKYCPAGSGSYKTCPKGSYCPEESSEPSSCGDGKTTNGTGATSIGDCVDNNTKCHSIDESCMLNGFAGTCIDSGSTAGGLVCKVTSPILPSEACPAGEYRAAGDCVTCPQDSYCPGGDDSTRHDCPVDRPKSNAGSTSISDCKTGGGNPSTPSGGDPSTPSGGDPSSGGNPSTPSGGDSGGNGNGNTNQNPNTATKTPLVIAIIGTMSMALGTFAYFKGKKEINTEI